MTRRSLALLALPLLLAAAPALAQTRPPEVPWSPARAARPFVMSDLSDSRVMGAEAGWGVLGEGDINSYLIELALDYAVTPNLKVVGRLPFTMVDIENPFVSDGEGSAIGNVQAGARLLSGGGNLRLGAGAEVALPTAPSLDTIDADTFAVLAAANLRFTDDPSRYIPDTMTVRLSGDARMTSGKAFGQAGAALSMYFYAGDQDLEDEQINYAHIFVGGGAFLTPQLAAMLELSTWWDLFDEVDGGEDFMHGLNIGLRYEAGSASIGGRFTYFLDESARDDGRRMFTIDVMARLP